MDEPNEPASIFPPEVMNMILGHRSAKTIINMCATSKLSTAICQNEGLWKLLIERDYPFAMDVDLYDMDINFDEDAYIQRPYYEKYTVIFSDLNVWANHFFKNFATCNKKYIKKKKVLKDVVKVLVELLNYTFQAPNRTFDKNKKHLTNVATDILSVMSGLSDDYIGYARGRLDFWKATETWIFNIETNLKDIITGYGMKVKEFTFHKESAEESEESSEEGNNEDEEEIED